MTRRRTLTSLTALTLAPASSALARIRPLGLVLPTDNDKIFSDPPSFYMYTDRNFEGRSSQPWEAGQYGFVRNPQRAGQHIIYTRFHEGVDIRPVRRDSSGEPLDEVRSIAAGTVVHASHDAGKSSYGRYAVVRHDWGYGDFYSLYAHLSSITAEVGAELSAGDSLGILGHTGPGLDRTRAHLHLELNLLISSRYQDWHDTHFTSPNHHGNYNGINLVGIDIASLYLAHRGDPNISIPAFLSGVPPYYRVTIPAARPLELLERYPWLGRGIADAPAHPSWDISLDPSGIPLAIAPSARATPRAAVSWVEGAGAHSSHTRGHLAGTGANASLSASGLRYIQLLSNTF